jgi:hypothetical protein
MVLLLKHSQLQSFLHHLFHRLAPVPCRTVSIYLFILLERLKFKHGRDMRGLLGVSGAPSRQTNRQLCSTELAM